MIRRINPDEKPKVPLKDFKWTTLNPIQVHDPSISADQRAEFQKKLSEHTNNYAAKALGKAFAHIDREMSKQIREEERALEELEIQEEDQRLRQMLEHHGFGDETKFRKKIQQMLPDFAHSLEYSSKESTEKRPTIAEDPHSHIKDAVDTKSLMPHLTDPNPRIRNVAQQRHKELKGKKE